MTNTFTNKGVEVIKLATQYDQQEDYDKAISQYSSGIQYLMMGLKYESNKTIKLTIRDKIDKYLKRAEEIKQIILTTPKKKPLKNGKRDDSKEEIDEQEEIENEDAIKLQKSLESAIVVEKPNVKWNDVAGLDIAKELLKEAVILPMRFPQLFVGKRQPWTGILLYGPPGTGKSYLAKAVATEANNSTFFSISSSDLISKYVGESEKLIKNLYKLAKLKKPSIVFIDEIDSLATKRSDKDGEYGRRVKTEFLVQLSGGTGMQDNNRVLTLGATNCPWDLDPAVRRRFSKRIYIPLPEKQARHIMFKIHIGNTKHELNNQQFDLLAQKTHGYSGSDINAIVQDALMEPIRALQSAEYFKKVYESDNKEEYVIIRGDGKDPDAFKARLFDISDEELAKVRAEPLRLCHFLKVLACVKPSVSVKDIEKQMEWTNRFGQKG